MPQVSSNTYVISLIIVYMMGFICGIIWLINQFKRGGKDE